VEVRSGGELADAARAFNEMAEQLQRSYEALARSERRYRLLADNATDIIWTADLDLRLTYVSPAATAHLGYSVGELMGPWGDRFMPGAARRRLRQAVERVLAREAAAGGPAAGEEPLELELTRRDGTPLWVEVRLSVLRDGAGAPVGVLGASRDVTERHRLAQLKADFVALTTHQLRTPLAGMKWLLELAGEAPELTGETRGYVRDVADQVDRLLEIVNNLLDGAQLESGAVRLAVAPTDLAILTEKVLADFEHAARALGHTVSLAVAPGLPPVLADPQLLRQALTNLVGNAVKYTPAGGRIEIAIERCGDAARWQVRDTGIGVPATARPRLFEKFYRADNASRMAPEGTGLGLYLARLIVERLGGRIWCESEEGRGATFAFTLPLEGA
jgi:PAS domain S-box-containing protein